MTTDLAEIKKIGHNISLITVQASCVFSAFVVAGQSIFFQNVRDRLLRNVQLDSHGSLPRSVLVLKCFLDFLH